MVLHFNPEDGMAAPRVAGFLGRNGSFKPYETKAEYVRHARLLAKTAREFRKAGDTVLAPDYEARVKGLIATARTL